MRLGDNSYKRTAWQRGRGMKTWVGFRQLMDHAKTDSLQTEATSNDHDNPHYIFCLDTLTHDILCCNNDKKVFS
jgi:hypothetical protein